LPDFADFQKTNFKKEVCKMKIKYEFTTETKEIEVDENTGKIIKELDRQDYNNFKKETRRHYSLDNAIDKFGNEPADKSSDLLENFIIQENIAEHKEKLAKLNKLLKTLNTEQQQLVHSVFFDRRTLTDIAAEYGLSVVAIHKRLKKIFEILRKKF